MFFWQWVHNQSVNAVLKKKNMLYNLLVLQAAAPMSTETWVLWKKALHFGHGSD